MSSYSLSVLEDEEEEVADEATLSLLVDTQQHLTQVRDIVVITAMCHKNTSFNSHCMAWTSGRRQSLDLTPYFLLC